MMFPRTAMLLAVAASLVTANGMPPTLAADTPAAKDQKKDATKDSKKESKKDAKKESKKSDSEKKKADKPPPACMQCGATCCLTAICVCEPGTKKKPKTEYEVECEPICMAGCGSLPWPFGRHESRVGCTDCGLRPCDCPGRVRYRKTLTKTTVDEEVCTIERTVGYLCQACAK